MKRISLVLLGVLLVNTLAVAQLRNFEQRGGATHDMRGDGLTAAHPNLAIGSKVMVVNTVTGKEVEVTITGRIPASYDRVVDLSPGAWQELGMTDGTPVRIYTSPVARPRPTPETPPPAQQVPVDLKEEEPPSEPPPAEKPPEIAEAPPLPPPEEDKSGGDSGQQQLAAAAVDDGDTDSQNKYLPLNLTVNTYLTSPEERAAGTYRQGSDTEFLAWLTTMMMDARDARESREVKDGHEYREARETREAREAREAREHREAREAREAREIREAREFQEARDTRDIREAREERYWRERELQGIKETVNFQVYPPASTSQPVAEPRPVPPVSNPAPAPAQPQVSAPAPALVVPPEPARQVHINPPAQRGEIQIIPGLPDRFTGKTHDIQVGAYSAPEAAARVVQLVRAAGFDVAQELQGSVYRVIVMKIPAADVYPAIQRLASLGLRQFWVRD